MVFTRYLSQECEIYQSVENTAWPLDAVGSPEVSLERINFSAGSEPKWTLACLYDPERFRSQEQDSMPTIARPLEFNQMVYTEWPPALPEEGITNDMKLKWLGVDPGPGKAPYPAQWFNIVSCNPVANPLAPTSGGHHLQIEVTRMYNI